MTLQQNTDHIQTTHIGSLRRPHNTNPSLAAAFIDRILNCARPRDLPARGFGLGQLQALRTGWVGADPF